MNRRFAFALVVAVVTLTACGTSRSPMAASESDEFAPAATTKTAGSDVTLTRQFMSVWVWGTITINGVPAPAGTLVAAVDRAGSAAAADKFIVWYPGHYGPMAVYLDNPATSLDEGVVPGEWLCIYVNSKPSRSKFQFTKFGDVVGGV